RRDRGTRRVSGVSNQTYDVVISGGGLVGASLAWALRQLPIKILLVEAVPLESDAQPSFDERTIAISRGSRRILEGIGVWDEVAAGARTTPSITVPERGRLGTAVIDAAEQGMDALGHVVPSRALGGALWGRIRSAGNIDLRCPASLSDPSARDDG